jgi:hypothetical protein
MLKRHVEEIKPNVHLKEEQYISRRWIYFCVYHPILFEVTWYISLTRYHMFEGTWYNALARYHMDTSFNLTHVE